MALVSIIRSEVEAVAGKQSLSHLAAMTAASSFDLFDIEKGVLSQLGFLRTGGASYTVQQKNG
jgi:hypothetical protein